MDFERTYSRVGVAKFCVGVTVTGSKIKVSNTLFLEGTPFGDERWSSGFFDS